MSNANNVLSRIFTQNALASIISTSGTLPPVYQAVVRRYSIPTDGSYSNAEVISEIYCIVEKSYRYEYYYKNTLLNKLIINVQRLHTTTALTEVPIAKSKADFIMINGKAVVYEIKTDLDTLDRLESQISDYYKAFDHVCIVTGEGKKDEVIAKFKGSPVGIYILTSRNTIKRFKEPKTYTMELELEQIFRVLRKAEYESIIRQLRGELPKVSPVRYYEECKRIICSYSVEQVYPLFLAELKKRNRIESIDYSSIPGALHFLVYFSKYRKKEIDRLCLFLEQTYNGGGC